MRLSTGARLGPYEVVALLGAGGMAEVYRAKDTRLGREVAIKVVSESLGTDGTFVERFEREARLVGSVSHPNVVALHDVGVHDGKPARERALALIKGYLSTRPAVLSGAIPFALIRLGRPEEGLDLLAGGPTANDAMAMPILWLRQGQAARTLPSFPDFARRIGLVEVWEQEGPPDLCQRTGRGAWVCH